MTTGIPKATWLGWVMTVAAAACGRTVEFDPPVTQEYRGFEISVLALEYAGSSFEDEMGAEWLAQSGEEIVAVSVHFKPVSATENLGMAQSGLELVDGSRVWTDVIGMNAASTRESSHWLPFRVPQSQKPSELYLYSGKDSLVYDLVQANE